MRRLLTALAAVGALLALSAAPAGAQEELGLEVDILEGSPGDVVNGLVDTDDVAEHCVTDLEEFMERFEELWADPDLYNNSAAGGALFDRFFPTGDFDYETHEQTAYPLTGLVVLGLSGLAGPEPAEGALPLTFVMTFADIATQEPIGEMGNFHPETGEGSAFVPDIDPGPWAVAAACVGPSFDLDTLEAGIRSSGPFLEELGVPFDFTSPAFTEFIEDFTGETGFEAIFAFVEEIGPTLLASIVEPDALGAQIFCILDADGECPSDEVPPDDEPGPAVAVIVDPTFTG